MIIHDFKTFKHDHTNSPILVEPGALLPLFNLAVIKCFIDIYTSQVKAKHKLIRTVDIAYGKHAQKSPHRFTHSNNECPHGNYLFSRHHIALPLEIEATGTMDHLTEPKVGNLIQRNRVPIPSSLTVKISFDNPSEHLPHPLVFESMGAPHLLESLPSLYDLPDLKSPNRLSK